MFSDLVRGGAIIDGASDPTANLALDEALARAQPGEPTLRVWGNPSCVVIGRGQRPHREADQKACARDGVPILRRASGGGAVYQDDGNLNVTLVLPPPVGKPLEAIGALLRATIAEFGLRSSIAERGLFVGEHKLCGFAVFRGQAGLLSHATLLVHTPAERIQTYLKPAPTDAQLLDSQRSPVASLAENGVEVATEDVASVLRAVARRRFGRGHFRAPDDVERRLQRRLLHARYHYAPWHTDGMQRQVAGGKTVAYQRTRATVAGALSARAQAPQQRTSEPRGVYGADSWTTTGCGYPA